MGAADRGARAAPSRDRARPARLRRESRGPQGSLRAAWTRAGARAGRLARASTSFAVVGNSAGGAIALSLACARPRAVTRVVAVGSMGHADAAARRARRAVGLRHAEPRGGARADRADQLRPAPRRRRRPSRRATRRRCAQPWYRELFPAPRQRWVDDLVADARRSSRAITAPVLLVHGAQDRVVPLRDSFLPLLEALPDVRGHVFGRCGHASPLEHTDEFNRLLTTSWRPTDDRLRRPARARPRCCSEPAWPRPPAASPPSHGRRVLVITDPVIARTPGLRHRRSTRSPRWTSRSSPRPPSTCRARRVDAAVALGRARRARRDRRGRRRQRDRPREGHRPAARPRRAARGLLRRQSVPGPGHAADRAADHGRHRLGGDAGRGHHRPARPR